MTGRGDRIGKGKDDKGVKEEKGLRGKLKGKKPNESKEGKSRKRDGMGFWLFALLGFAVLAAQGLGILDATEWRLQDGYYQKGELVSPEIFVIGIDEETMMEYGSWQNWSRTGVAELLRVLNRDPDMAPVVIGLDIGFFGESSQEADDALAEAASLKDNVVVTSYASFGKEIAEDGLGGFSTKEGVATYEVPYDGLKQHVTYGFSNVPVDSDGIVRHSLYRIQAGEELQYSFAVEIYRKYMGQLPAIIEEGREGGYVPFAGQPFDFYGSETAGLSFSKVVSGEIPSELFAGCIVLVGPYTTGMMDAYYTAVSHDTPMYGVEVHANILQSLLEENQKKELAVWICLLLTGATMGLVLLGLKLRRIAASAGFTGLILASYWVGAKIGYRQGYVLPLIYPMGAPVLLYVCYIGRQYVAERRAKKRLEGIFGKYVSKEVAQNLVKGGEEALKLGGQKKEVAVLFVDIRGFTPLSESLPPEKVVEILNHYLELTTKAVFDNKGTVDKFIGDATMAIYNAPLDLDDYVFRAVKTGLDIVNAAEILAKELESMNLQRPGVGVGINCGEAVIGNIGTTSRMDYTAIGNTVNVAARLESSAKAGQVIISQEVYERLEGRILAEDLGKRQLKGIAGEVAVYRVTGVVS